MVQRKRRPKRNKTISATTVPQFLKRLGTNALFAKTTRFVKCVKILLTTLIQCSSLNLITSSQVKYHRVSHSRLTRNQLVTSLTKVAHLVRLEMGLLTGKTWLEVFMIVITTIQTSGRSKTAQVVARRTYLRNNEHY